MATMHFFGVVNSSNPRFSFPRKIIRINTTISVTHGKSKVEFFRDPDPRIAKSILIKL